MTARLRVIVAFCALALGAGFFLPLWRVSLNAPQYPEGLGIQIWIDNIGGIEKHDLTKINNLNHYIGMKRIEPDSIPELKFMPYLLAGLLVLGVFSAAVGKRFVFYSWLVSFGVLAGAGLADFYRWTYDYGHNLDMESAIIKIPGMNYQPPIIGTKQLLNFTATSMPDAGGLTLIAAFLCAIVFALWEWRRKTPQSSRSSVQKSIAVPALFALGALSFFSVQCSRGPEPIQYGQDICAFCTMTISDTRYGTELVTKKGKNYKFDSVECLANYYLSDKVASDDLRSVWVTSFVAPNGLWDATGASFLQSEKLPSPMGMNLTAFQSPTQARSAKAEHGGDLLDWAGVLTLIRQSRA